MRNPIFASYLSTAKSVFEAKEVSNGVLHGVVQEEDDMFDEDASDVQWTLGSPLKWMTAEQLQQDLKDKNFAAKLCVFLNDFVVDPPLQPHNIIEVYCNLVKFILTLLTHFQIKSHCCSRLKYQSCVNWTEKTDILRCNPNFHNNRCYDHVLVNDKPENLTVAHLMLLLRCWLPDKSLHDIAVVCMLKPSKWVPKTKWAGCRVYNEEKALGFVMAKYLIHIYDPRFQGEQAILDVSKRPD
ncbi:hypothetical protein B0H14DRAFT_3171616 [Mycena olivaceomarginata]|nr:hypothetical protein B0H14DRAFT_3171616 [Mycena olivaceomarginata]